MSKVKDAFRRVSWWGFLSFLIMVVALVVGIVAVVSHSYFGLAVAGLILGFAIYFVLVSFRDE